MSMGNFIRGEDVATSVMATAPNGPDEEVSFGVSHPTVVPANFDPDAPNGRQG